MTGFTVDAATLALQTTGLVPEGGRHTRQVLLDEVEARLPRDPESRINIQLSELNPGQTGSWHIHNGVVYFVLLRGIITLQYEGMSEHYSAGEVYAEPIGGRASGPQPAPRHSGLPGRFLGYRRRPPPHQRYRRTGLDSEYRASSRAGLVRCFA